MKPIGIRFWHWLNALAIFGLLATVLLRKTVLSWRANSVIIQDKITAAGGQIDPELAKSIAQAIRDPMWEWHYIFGFSLTALFVFRIFLMVRDRSTRPRLAGLDLHHKLVQLGYVGFYVMTLFMMGSGLSMYFKEFLGLGESAVDFIKEYHETAMWFFAVFAGAHIVGVIVAENRDEPGIVSRMINGGGGPPQD